MGKILRTVEDIRISKRIAIRSIRAAAHCSPALTQIAYRLEQEDSDRPDRVQGLAGDASWIGMECVKVLGMIPELDNAIQDSVALFLLCSGSFARCACGEVAGRSGCCDECLSGCCDDSRGAST